MKFLSLVAALLFEQLWPLRRGNRVYQWFGSYAGAIEHYVNGGNYNHGVIGWVLAVLPVVVAAMVIHALLTAVSPLLGWAWSLAVLYLTMGFRQFSHYFTEILLALRENRLDAARADLSSWSGDSTAEFSSGEIATVAIEQGLIGSHRHVFGPIAWFIVFGPAGAIAYRMAGMLGEQWGRRTDAEFGAFGQFAQRVFYWFDWLPARVTAASFAIVGNFEDAVYCWRTQALGWADRMEGVILAAGAGAVGVRLGDSLHEQGSVRLRPEMGMGETADVDCMQSTVGLIWRALVLWMFLLFVVTVAYALG
ncbi:MAG: CobD/CbiB family protein [Betaproteobacteria bacterium]|nr:CobD/CbiB family protein [Betaproteobacteria bacterium]